MCSFLMKWKKILEDGEWQPLFIAYMNTFPLKPVAGDRLSSALKFTLIFDVFGKYT